MLRLHNELSEQVHTAIQDSEQQRIPICRACKRPVHRMCKLRYRMPGFGNYGIQGKNLRRYGRKDIIERK